MGAYYTYCHLCGDELSGRWDPETDPEDAPEPLQVSTRRRNHELECLVRLQIAAFAGLVRMAEAIRRSYVACDYCDGTGWGREPDYCCKCRGSGDRSQWLADGRD